MSDEIQQTRYDRLVRRVTGIIGPGSKVAQVITELFPMIDVERVPSELLLLAGTRICMGGGTVSATAAEAGKAQLFNPPNSGMLITLTDIYFSSGGVSVIRWGRSAATFGAAISTQVFTDFRNDPSALPVGEIHQLSVAALATATNQVRILANVEFHISSKNDICVLSPGFGFEIGSGLTNSAIHFGFNWRERPAESSELDI